MSIETIDTQMDWDELILSRSGHPLQLWGWGEVKRRHNWQVERIVVKEDDVVVGAVQLLIRRLPWPLKSLVYVPRGPVAEEGDREGVLAEICDYVRRKYHAVALTVEPAWDKPTGLGKWRKSLNDILLARTLVLDLGKSEEELLADMTKKTRQYIRKSSKEDLKILHVKSRRELDGCLELYKQTAVRAKFSLHDNQYYYDVFDQLDDHSPVFVATGGGNPLAFVWLAASQSTAFELYGGMSEEGSELRANYALKWHAIKKMKSWGIEKYDMNGLLNDGVSRFKQGFAGHENEWVGTYDMPLSPFYSLWAKGLPAAKKLIRLTKR